VGWYVMTTSAAPGSPSINPTSSEKTYRAALAVTLKKKSEHLELLTSEICFSGAFIRTSNGPPINSLVRLLFTLPPGDDVLDLSAHVTNVIPPNSEGDHYPGFAARFIALNGEVKRRWESLIQSLRKVSPEQDTISFARPSYVMRVQLKEPAAVDLPLRPSSFDELAELIEQQIPAGTLFVPTTQPLVLGAAVNVKIVHPITNETLDLPGSVVRRGSTSPGALVRLAPLDDEMRAIVKEFEDSVVISVDYDVEIFDEPKIKQTAKWPPPRLP
jgi:hypothetical protein